MVIVIYPDCQQSGFNMNIPSEAISVAVASSHGYFSEIDAEEILQDLGKEFSNVTVRTHLPIPGSSNRETKYTVELDIPTGRRVCTIESLFGGLPPYSNFFTLFVESELPIPMWFYRKYYIPGDPEWGGFVGNVKKWNNQ